MKTFNLENLGQGKFRLTTIATRNDGSQYEITDILYSSNELASNAAKEKKEQWGSNLVLLGNEIKNVNGVDYYYPTFNVWD